MSDWQLEEFKLSSVPRVPMVTIDRGILAGVAIVTIVGSMALGFLTGSGYFVMAGLGIPLAGFLFLAAFMPTEPPTKPKVGPEAAAQKNVLSIIALCAACVSGLAVPAVVMGHIARSQISQTGGGGDKLALVAMTIGYAQVLVSALVFIWFLTILVH